MPRIRPVATSGNGSSGGSPTRPGLIALMGSGETSPDGRKGHDYILSRLQEHPLIGVLETPAGFQPNVARVAEKIVEFLRNRLRNYQPRVYTIEARKRGTSYDPDLPQIAHFVLPADYIFAGPGSPTYAARQLRNTRTLQNLVRRHQEGAALGFASAAALAVGTWVLPVYEIYKSGEEPRWEPGLDLLAPFGLDITIVTHWNNQEGGRELDTSRCYMGEKRFAELRRLLPPHTIILGVDERVTCVLDLAAGTGIVIGPGSVTIMEDERTQTYPAGSCFPIDELRPRRG